MKVTVRDATVFEGKRDPLLLDLHQDIRFGRATTHHRLQPSHSVDNLTSHRSGGDLSRLNVEVARQLAWPRLREPQPRGSCGERELSR